MNSENDFKKYDEITSCRLLIERLFKPLSDKFSPICSQIEEINRDTQICKQKVGESEAFLRRLSIFYQEFEKLFQQVQEFEVYKEVLENRRQDDLRKTQYMIQEIDTELKNRSDDFRIGLNHMDVLAKQFKEMMKETIIHRQAVNEKVSGLEVKISEANDHYFNNIDSIKLKIEENVNSIEKIAIQYAEATAKVDIIEQQLKGIKK